MNNLNEINDVYLIAEIGGNHEGDFDLAVHLAKEAIQSGADAVKFQIYDGNTLVNGFVDADRVKHFSKFSLTKDQYLDLHEICKSAGVDFLASIWDEEAMDVFCPLMPFIKVGSGDLTCHSLLKKLSQFNKPIVLSTGLANLDEIRTAILHLQESNKFFKQPGTIALLQCTTMYPIPDQDAELSVIRTLAENFKDCIVGYSDHTEGTYAAELAYAIGAKIIEVHFTCPSIKSKFRDHKVSFTKHNIIELKKRFQKISGLLGTGVKRPMQSELNADHLISFRRALFPRKDIPAGTTIKMDDLVALRPCVGLPAENADYIIGKKLEIDLKKLQPIKLNLVIN